MLGRLRLVIREEREFLGLSDAPTSKEQNLINEIIDYEASQRRSPSRRSSGSFYDVLRVLIVSWFRQQGPLTSKRICEITGYSYQTVAQALNELEPRLTRHSDRSVELMAFPKSDWMRFISNSAKLRGRVSFTDRSGSPRPAEKVLARLRKTNSEEPWFIEFLTTPESVEKEGQQWTPLELPEGYFGLPSFRFLALTGHEPLVAGPDDLEEAHHTCVSGLLSSQPPTEEALRIAGERLMLEAVESLEAWGKGT